jgi:hypothetical protein
MKPILPLFCLALSGACAEQTSGRYPSLLPRPIEKRSDAEPVAAVAGPVAPDPALDAKIATFRKALDDGNAAFAAVAVRAGQAANAAKGQPAGSDPWIAAQTALAELDMLRSDTSSTQTDIESIAITRAADGAPDYPALVALQASAETALADQAARIEAIQAI